MNKTNISSECLPPKEFMPRNCKLLPELNYPEKLNLAQLLLDCNIPHRADKVAIYHDEERITYGELHARVNQFANALRELGVGRNDRVVLRSANSPEHIIWNFACWRIGAIPVLVSALNRSAEVAFKLNDSEAVAVCVDSESYADVGMVRDRSPNLKHVIVHGHRIPGALNFEELCKKQSQVAESELVSHEDFGRIIYSSGTTGKPKAILTTTEGILSLMDTHSRHVLKIRSDDVLGGHPYFSFAFGAVSFLYVPWRFGTSVSVTSHFAPERQFELIEQHGITILFAVPTALRMMLGLHDAEKKYNLSSLRLAQSAGEPLPDLTRQQWRERFGQTILNSLGSGELNYWLSTTEDMPEEKLGSNGLSVPGYENLVVDENLNPVPPGTPGELIVRGPVGQMYWRRPEDQQKAVCAPNTRYAGWSRPGLYFIQDADGYFWYKSRLDDMIVTSGYKVPGGEVEVALNSHPAVLESAVVGVPDDERGNIIKAFVVLKEGVRPTPQLAQYLKDFVKQELEPYKYPRLLEFTSAEALPRTSTGKIQRKALRDLELARSAARGERQADTEFAAAVRASAMKEFESGLYCAESALVALAKAQGIESELVPKVATVFCSGMARKCGTCGALTGALMGLSLAFGRTSSGQSVQSSYRAAQQLIDKFEQEFGARNCNDLLGCDLGTPEGQAMFRDNKLHERCARYTARAAEIAASLIADARV
jgi:2-aminobenzoate-CoA ligase